MFSTNVISSRLYESFSTTDWCSLLLANAAPPLLQASHVVTMIACKRGSRSGYHRRFKPRLCFAGLWKFWPFGWHTKYSSYGLTTKKKPRTMLGSGCCWCPMTWHCKSPGFSAAMLWHHKSTPNYLHYQGVLFTFRIFDELSLAEHLQSVANKVGFDLVFLS